MTVTAEDVREMRDGARHYIYPPTSDRFPSVTTVLGATDSKPYLVPWSAKIAAEYAVGNWRMLLNLIRKEGTQAAISLVKEQSELIRKRKADAGTYVHRVVEALILWAEAGAQGSSIAYPELPEKLRGVTYDDEPLEKVVTWMVDGFVNCVRAFNPLFEAAEMVVFNVTLGVAGTLDMIIVLRDVAIGRAGRLVPCPGNRVVLCVDVKTGKHLDITIPEQLAAYRRMQEALLRLGNLIPMPPTDAAAVLHLRPEHRDGYRLILIAGEDDAKGWNRFRRAVELYEGRKEAKRKLGKVCYPLRADGTMQSPLLADLDGEGYGRVPGALVKVGVEDLETLASLSAEECLQLKGIKEKSLEVIQVMLADHGLHLAGESAPEMARKAA